MNEFERLLQAFRFDVKPFNFANMKKEFIHTVRQNPGEFLPIENEDDHIIRFDFARRIFLDRGLWMGQKNWIEYFNDCELVEWIK